MEPEAVDDETQARFDEYRGEQRAEQLRSQLDLTGRANAAFASAVGLDASEIPAGVAARTRARRPSMQEPQLTRVGSCQAF